MIVVPHRPRWLSPLSLLYGVILFIWLTPEDNSVITVTVLGVVGACVLAANFVTRSGGRKLPRWAARLALLLGGAGLGAGANAFTVALMFLKTSLHAHISPDYSPALLIAMLQRLPPWTLAGLLLGAALLLAIPVPSAKEDSAA